MDAAFVSILLISSDQELKKFLEESFQNQGITILVKKETDQWISLIHDQSIDICLLNCLCSEEEWVEHLCQIKKYNLNINLIPILSNPTADFVIKLIRLGAADILTRPIDKKLLLDRLAQFIQNVKEEKTKEHYLTEIQYLLGKVVEEAGETKSNSKPEQVKKFLDQNLSIFSKEKIEIDPATRQVFLPGSKAYTLSTTNFSYLQVLIDHAPHAVPFAQLVYEAQGFDLPCHEAKNLAFWHVHRLRKKLKNGLQQDPIETVRGYGYKLTNTVI